MIDITTKEKLINATMQLVNEDGFSNASTSRIAKLAGFSEATIYKHFTSKDALLVEVYLIIKADMNRAIIFGVKNITTIKDRAYKLFNNYLDYLLSNPEKLKYYLQFTNSNYMSKVVFDKGMERFGELIDCVNESINQGDIKDMPISFYYAFVHVPILEIARATINHEIELTEDIRNKVINNCIDIVSKAE